MKKLFVLIAVLTIIISCDDDLTRPTGTISNNWVIKPDSVNIAILILSSDGTLEGGVLNYYAPCNDCGVDSIPFTKNFSYSSRELRGSLSFQYSVTSDLVLSVTSYRSELGQINFPTNLMPPDSFKTNHFSYKEPADPECWSFSYHNLLAGTDQCWESINRLDIVNAFIRSGRYRIGYLHCRLGSGDDHLVQYKWVIFLFKENE